MGQNKQRDEYCILFSGNLESRGNYNIFTSVLDMTIAQIQVNLTRPFILQYNIGPCYDDSTHDCYSHPVMRLLIL